MLDRIIEFFWKENSHIGLRARADVLLGVGWTSRGQVQRMVQFSDVGATYFEIEGVQGAMLVQCALYQSKTNNFNHIERKGCFRYLILLINSLQT